MRPAGAAVVIVLFGAAWTAPLATASTPGLCSWIEQGRANTDGALDEIYSQLTADQEMPTYGACYDYMTGTGSSAEEADRACSEQDRERAGRDTEIAEVLVGHFDATVLPVLRSALEDDRMIGCAQRELVAWSTKVDMLPTVDPLRPPGSRLIRQRTYGYELLTAAFAHAFTQSLRRCVANGDITELALLETYVRESQMLPESVPGAEDLSNYLPGAWRHCGRFELTLRSEITFTDKEGRYERSSAIAERIPIRVEDVQQTGLPHWTGSGRLRSAGASFGDDRCVQFVKDSSTKIKVVRLWFQMGERDMPCACDPPGEPARVEEIVLTLWIGKLYLEAGNVSASADCPIVASSRVPHWNWGFEHVHPRYEAFVEDIDTVLLFYDIEDWTVYSGSGSGLLAKKESRCPGRSEGCPARPPKADEVSNSYASYVERSDFFLYHVPEPGASEPRASASGGAGPGGSASGGTEAGAEIPGAAGPDGPAPARSEPRE